jgi:hypothetical protein
VLCFNSQWKADHCHLVCKTHYGIKVVEDADHPIYHSVQEEKLKLNQS